jgi:hypothetical protein
VNDPEKLGPTFIQLLKTNNYSLYTTNTTIYYNIQQGFLVGARIAEIPKLSCFSWINALNSDLLKLGESWV